MNKLEYFNISLMLVAIILFVFVRQTQTVSAVTEEQSASMEEIAASSQALAKMATELTQAVSRFKI